MTMCREYDASGVLIAEWDDGAPDPPVLDTTVNARVDTAALTSAVAAAQTATTIAGVRAAVLKLAAAITPMDS